jgi:hypothetical protein
MDMIDKAREGEDQLICITTHSYNNIQKYVDNRLPDILRYCNLSDVPVQFQTASEAAATIQGACDLTRPEIEVEQREDSLIISVNENIFQKTPYCVLEYSSGSLARIYPSPTKRREWVVKLPDSGASRFACAVSNLNGQAAVIRVDLD